MRPSRNRARSLLLALGLTACTGCASAQKLSVHTTPAGAEVFLQRRGELEVEATVAGVHGNVRGGSFEEEYFSLGSAPVDYQFDLEERDSAGLGEYAGGSVTRRFEEGTVRVDLRGYRPVERRVRFSGDAVRLRITLERVDEP